MAPLPSFDARDVGPDDDPLRRPQGARGARPVRHEAPLPAPDQASRELELESLRTRMREAREERGRCPSWDELRQDLLPGGSSRPGREERLAHAEICPYCAPHIAEWKKSFDHTADTLEAVERSVVKGIAGGAKQLWGSLKPRAKAERPAPEAKTEEPPPQGPADPIPMPAQRMYVPPPEATAPAAPAARSQREAGIVVVEVTKISRTPQSVHLCAEAIECEVAEVESIEELAGDPDLRLVRAVILHGYSPPDGWPDRVRRARALVPSCPVVLLAPYGASPSAGARRALGDVLLNEADPAERLLVVLDPRLR